MIIDLKGKPIDGGEPPEPEINELLVKELERALAKAKSGELQAAGYIFIHDDEQWSDGWCIRNLGDSSDLIAGCAVLSKKMVQMLINDEEPLIDPDDAA